MFITKTRDEVSWHVERGPRTLQFDRALTCFHLVDSKNYQNEYRHFFPSHLVFSQPYGKEFRVCATMFVYISSLIFDLKAFSVNLGLELIVLCMLILYYLVFTLHFSVIWEKLIFLMRRGWKNLACIW